jgi:hypothetical protein
LFAKDLPITLAKLANHIATTVERKPGNQGLISVAVVSFLGAFQQFPNSLTPRRSCRQHP